MPQPTNKITQFWQELKRRKVLPFLIAYIAACFAIIEFFDITSNRFAIPDGTFTLLYILAGIGVPLVIILPWFIYRKQKDDYMEDLTLELKPPVHFEKKVLHNLPAQLTTFIGRKKEMETVRELISEHRIVTLTGAGGCGKTRLAIEVAIQLIQDYEDGVWFVDLAPIASEDLVAKEITEALRIAEVPIQPIIDTIIDKIRDKNLLIILDNCEHLIKGCAEISSKLLQKVAGLKIIATSREALNISGEKIWHIPSLTLLDPKTIIDLESARNSEAVLLFADRAQLNNPDFSLRSENVSEVVSICNKLDGIPLAVELVASRTRHLSPGKILERFEDRFDSLSSLNPVISKRQQTLHATIDWSYNLLSEAEQILFTRIAVFSGGFDLEAAEEVCSDVLLSRENILDLLSRLVDRSLVYTKTGGDQSIRYNRLETLRQYAKQKLNSNNEEEKIRSSHLKYYLKMAEDAYEEQFEAQLKWTNWFEVEQDNLLSAMNWAESNSPEEFAQLTGAMFWIWRQLSNITMGKDYLERALSKEISNSGNYARVVFGYGLFNWLTGDVQKALPLMNESLDIWRKFKNLREEAFVLSEISEPLLHSGDYETSLKYSELGLEIARKVGNPGLINHCLIYLCTILVHTKQYERGRPLVEELLLSSEKLEHILGIESALHLLGDCTVGTRDFKEGEKRYAQGVETSLRYGNMLYATLDIQGVAFALSGQKRWAKSIRLDAAAREQLKKLGMVIDGMLGFWDEWIDTYIEGAKKEVGEDLARLYEEEGIAMGFDKAVEYALDFKKD